MLFCHSMNAGCAGGTLRGGVDTQTLLAIIEKIELFALTDGRDAQTSHSHPSCPLAPHVPKSPGESFTT